MDEIFEICLKQAEISYKHSDVPVGAVIVQNGKILAKSHNNREKKHNVLGHAEINAIIKASKKLKRWNLSDCELYVTLRPCSMCESVIKQARIGQVYYLLDKLDYKKEFSNSKLCKVNVNNYEQMYQKMLSSFFKNKR